LNFIAKIVMFLLLGSTGTCTIKLLIGIDHLATPLYWTMLVLIFIYFFEGRDFERFGLSLKLKALLYSLKFLILGLFSALIVWSILMVTRLMIIIGYSDTFYHRFLELIIKCLVIALGEELTFRAYILRVVSDNTNLFLGLLSSSLLFMMAHVLNPNVHLLALTNILIAGLMLGVLMVKYNSLFVPWGFHTGWNFMIEVLGSPISGVKPEIYIFKVKLLPPCMISGCRFGIEGGILFTILMLILMFLIHLKKP